MKQMLPAETTHAHREPPPDPGRSPDPDPAPWHDPGPPVREVDLPPNNPSRGIPVENPELPRPDR